MTRAGLLLVNLGTPDAPTARAVRRYLREFLMDPRVIDIAPLLRFLLVQGVIAPFRSRKSAAAYRKIWTERGSPLLAHSRDLLAAVRARLPSVPVELAMRYGTPSIASGVAALLATGIDRLVLFPLYPQFAESSTASTVAEVERQLLGRAPPAELTTIGAFFDHPAFIGAFAAVGAPVLAEAAPEHVLFSFHGLPERHVRATDPSGRHCLASEDCCARIVRENAACYRAQCFATARALAARLGLADGTWSVAFQSRLGRTPWIPPFTDVEVPALAARGVKRLAVFCPAFVADCLETLEEIGIRAADSFRGSGGDRLVLVPSLNAHPDWADAVATLARPALGG